MQISGSSGLAQVLQQMQAKVEEAFNQADADGDGKLSKEEFAAMDASTQGKDVASDASNAVFAKLDADGDGAVTLAEIEAKQTTGSLSSDTLAEILAFSQSQTTMNITDFLDGTGDVISAATGNNTDTSQMDSFVKQMVARYAASGYGTEDAVSATTEA